LSTSSNRNGRFFHNVFHVLGGMATLYTLIQLVQSAFKHRKAARAIATVAFFVGTLYAMIVAAVIVAPMFLNLLLKTHSRYSISTSLSALVATFWPE
jgi:flagellar motor component MotA